MNERADHEPVGLIGLGLMGTVLTERLLEHGFPVAVWNRTRAKADPLVARGALWSDNPLASCRRVIVSLYTTVHGGAHAGSRGGRDRPGQSGRSQRPHAGAGCELPLLLGLIVIWWAPDTSRKNLQE